jgi:hypothetical protein
VALVHGLEEGNLGLPSQVHVLSAISNELHKSTGHFVLYPKKKISEPRAQATRRFSGTLLNVSCATPPTAKPPT